MVRIDHLERGRGNFEESASFKTTPRLLYFSSCTDPITTYLPTYLLLGLRRHQLRLDELSEHLFLLVHRR